MARNTAWLNHRSIHHLHQALYILDLKGLEENPGSRQSAGHCPPKNRFHQVGCSHVYWVHRGFPTADPCGHFTFSG